MEQLHKYYLVFQAMPPQELADGVEVEGAGLNTEEYSKAFFVVNIGAMAASELVFQVVASAIGQVGWTQKAATSGWASANETFGIDVDLFGNTISGYMRAELTAIGDVAQVGVSAIMYEHSGLLPDASQITVVEL